MTKTSNIDLEPLPDDDTIVAIVRVCITERMQAMATASAAGRGYFTDPCPSANLLARRLHIKGARRAGNGAVKGSWSGTMSPALRLAPRLRALVTAGRLVSADRDNDRAHGPLVYDIAGEEWWRTRPTEPPAAAPKPSR